MLVADSTDRLQRRQHPLLVAVGGINHQHVRAGLQQTPGPGVHIAADPDRGPDPQRPVRVQRRRVQRRTQRTFAGHQPHQGLVCRDHYRHLLVTGP